ncbi:MAG: hypothetical protein ABL879_15770 [Devosia sp.]
MQEIEGVPVKLASLSRSRLSDVVVSALLEFREVDLLEFLFEDFACLEFYHRSQRNDDCLVGSIGISADARPAQLHFQNSEIAQLDVSSLGQRALDSVERLLHVIDDLFLREPGLPENLQHDLMFGQVGHGVNCTVLIGALSAFPVGLKIFDRGAHQFTDRDSFLPRGTPEIHTLTSRDAHRDLQAPFLGRGEPTEIELRQGEAHGFTRGLESAGFSGGFDLVEDRDREIDGERAGGVRGTFFWGHRRPSLQCWVASLGKDTRFV